MHRPTVVAPLLLLLGCSGGGPGALFDGDSVSGTVNGETVSTGSAVLVQRQDDEDTILVVMSPASCAEQAAVYTALDDDTASVSQLVDIWNDTFPAEWWKLYMRFRVGSSSSDLTGQVIPGHNWLNDVSGEPVYGRFMHYKKRLDEGWFDSSASEQDDYYVRWSSQGGSMTIEDHDPDEQLKGSFVTSVVDSSEEDRIVGELDIEFTAERCPELDEYLGALGYL